MEGKVLDEPDLFRLSILCFIQTKKEAFFFPVSSWYLVVCHANFDSKTLENRAKMIPLSVLAAV